MAERKPFLLRLDPGLHAQLQKWADDELRSLNGQIEFLLRDALRRSGRLPGAAGGPLQGGSGSPPIGRHVEHNGGEQIGGEGARGEQTGGGQSGEGPSEIDRPAGGSAGEG